MASTRHLPLLAVICAVVFFVGLPLGVTTPARASVGDTVTEIHYSFGNTPDSVVFSWVGQEQEIDYGVTIDYGQTAIASPSPVTPVDSAGPFRQVALTGSAQVAPHSRPQVTYRPSLVRG